MYGTSGVGAGKTRNLFPNHFRYNVRYVFRSGTRNSEYKKTTTDVRMIERMVRSGLVIVALLASYVSGDETCGIYGSWGNRLGGGVGPVPVLRGENGTEGELRLENLTPRGLKSENCTTDYVRMVCEGNRLRFLLEDGFPFPDECGFVFEVQLGDECPGDTQTEYSIKYFLAPSFDKLDYVTKMTFPVPNGTFLGEEMSVIHDREGVRLKVEKPFEGIELIVLNRSESATTFRLITRKVIYLVDDLELKLTAMSESGELMSKADFRLKLGEDSAVPRPIFERSIYEVMVQTRNLDIAKTIYPKGSVKLEEDIIGARFLVEPMNENDLDFKVDHDEISGSVDIGLKKLPLVNTTSQEIFLQLKARVRNIYGKENEGFTCLRVRVLGEPKCIASPRIFDSENEEHLRIAVIVLSIAVVFLLFLVFYLYFKYVCIRKAPEPRPPPKETAPAVKHRRPTPRKISEYPYPLDKLPPPLETLAETEEDSDGKQLEIKISKGEEEPVGKTRKRSMTFLESDQESRQNREAPEEEKKVSEGNQRRLSEDEERRRRKSSSKMYHSLT